MKNPETKNLTIPRKRIIIQEAFPGLEISVSTVAKVFVLLKNFMSYKDSKKIVTI